MIPVLVAMLLGARRREPQRTRFDCLDDQRCHLLDLVGGCSFEVGSSLSHDVGAKGSVGHLDAYIERQRGVFNRIHELGEALPVPANPLGKGRAGNVFDAFHEAQ